MENLKDIDELYLIYLEFKIINYLEHLVIEDSDSGYITVDDCNFYLQDVLFFLKDKYLETIIKMKKFLM